EQRANECCFGDMRPFRHALQPLGLLVVEQHIDSARHRPTVAVLVQATRTPTTLQTGGVRNLRLVSVTLRVRNVPASAWFYRDAFGVQLEPGEGPEPHAEASWRDGAHLLLTLHPAAEGATANAEIGFHVE